MRDRKPGRVVRGHLTWLHTFHCRKAWGEDVGGVDPAQVEESWVKTLIYPIPRNYSLTVAKVSFPTEYNAILSQILTFVTSFTFAVSWKFFLEIPQHVKKRTAFSNASFPAESAGLSRIRFC